MHRLLKVEPKDLFIHNFAELESYVKESFETYNSK